MFHLSPFSTFFRTTENIHTKLQRNDSADLSTSVRHCVLLHFHDLLKRHNRASFAFIIYKHLRQLLFIITGYTVRKYMNVISIFSHIKAGRFDTGRSIRPNNIKVGNTMLLNKSSKCIAGQGVAL